MTTCVTVMFCFVLCSHVLFRNLASQVNAAIHKDKLSKVQAIKLKDALLKVDSYTFSMCFMCHLFHAMCLSMCHVSHAGRRQEKLPLEPMSKDFLPISKELV